MSTVENPIQKQHMTSEDDVIDFKDILAIILENRKLVLSAIASFMSIGIMVCIFRTPVYQSSALLSIEGNNNTDMIASIIGDAAPSLGNRNSMFKSLTEISILQSRSVLEPVAKNLYLDINVHAKTFPFIGKLIARRYDKTHHGALATPWFGLDRYNWGGANLHVTTLKVPADAIGQPLTVTSLGKGQYTVQFSDFPIVTAHVGQIAQIPLPNQDPITLRIDKITANPGTVFTVSKGHLASAVAALRGALIISETDRGSSLLDIKFKSSSARVAKSTLDALLQTAIHNSILRKSNEAIQTLGFLNKQLPMAKTELQDAETRLNGYRSKTGNIEINTEAKRVLAQLTEVEQALSKSAIEKARLRQQYTDTSFQIEQIDTTIAQLQKQKAMLDQQLKTIPNADQVAISLTRDVKIRNTVYTTLLNNIQQFELIKAGTQGQLTIIDHADMPISAINKPASLVIALSAFLGAFFSLGFIFVKRYFWQGIEDPDIIENTFGLSILGALHKCEIHTKQCEKYNNKQIKNLKLVAEIDPHDLTVEGMRSLRTNILFRMSDPSHNVIAISGPVPGVGKSFTAANIAHALSDLNKRVLLIDADIRKGDLHYFFLPDRNEGLSDLLKGDITLEQSIHKTRLPNIDFMPTGRMPEKHAELLMQPQTKELITHLRKEYDFVVIDTAPILAVTDATFLLKLADLRILTLAYGKHDKSEVELSIAQFNKAGISLDGFTFNMIQQSHTYYGGKYYKYKYGYKYGQSKDAS